VKTYFRFLRNHKIDLNNGVEYMPEVRIVEKAMNGRLVNRTALVCVFDIGVESKLHPVNLWDETPKLPRDFDKLTPALQRGIEEQAVEVALANREKNRATREALEFYEAQGVLQIVEADEVTA
jgi:hypothetical protein